MTEIIIDFTEKNFTTPEELTKLIEYYPNDTYLLVTPAQKKLIMGFDKYMGFHIRLGFKYDVLFFSTFNNDIDKTVSVCTANDFEKRITTETLYESYEFANKLSNINQFSNLIEGLKNMAGSKNAL